MTLLIALGVAFGLLFGVALPVGIAEAFFYFKRRAHRVATLAAFDREFPEALAYRARMEAGPRSLAEHMYVSHEGDLPSHWEPEA